MFQLLDTGTGSRYANLSYWKARRVLFYRNGDPYFPGVEFRFKPGRDIATLESLLDKLSLRMDLPRYELPIYQIIDNFLKIFYKSEAKNHFYVKSK